MRLCLRKFPPLRLQKAIFNSPCLLIHINTKTIWNLGLTPRPHSIEGELIHWVDKAKNKWLIVGQLESCVMNVVLVLWGVGSILRNRPKSMFHCFREVRCQQGGTLGYNIRDILLKDSHLYCTSAAKWLARQRSTAENRVCFPGGQNIHYLTNSLILWTFF